MQNIFFQAIEPPKNPFYHFILNFVEK